MKIHINQTVGHLVAQDYRLASVFKSLGIDFCCHGNKSLKEVCNERNISFEMIVQQLELMLLHEKKETVDYQSWSVDQLVNHIEIKHHRYVEKAILELKPYLNKVVEVHGDKHPELFEIKNYFNTVAEELSKHMMKEELMLFPYISRLAKAMKTGASVGKPAFGTVKNPIEMMQREHSDEGDRFNEIAILTNNYNPPQDACNTFKVTYALLKEFEEDLHLHIHLENNILFPKTIALEEELNSILQ
ncbi:MULTISPECIES: iron-sulfur cluster repair di-iron protein [unclassified Flavobacterium]|uniref:iron-sulfur cluster repair di-iron protein n=1 Tax=unclassified Flavobacterium TaxID=196869 RepID=UPI000EAB5FB1|nr:MULTISPECIES: iron-sulfur cluster repair di-iron protein [unclassified Flavobacterium]RKS01645.1 regulator of cell morphogenesis and NO signaling [Flavobacterium sp. 102]